MYKRIVLAYDGSVEGRTALRDGALLAKQCRAEVFLLSVLPDPGTLLLTEVTLAGSSLMATNGSSKPNGLMVRSSTIAHSRHMMKL
jgi:nucleotide-binding universal stress UspA family protein